MMKKVTFDHSQTQSISACDSPKLLSGCGQCKQENGEVLKYERCLGISGVARILNWRGPSDN